MCIYLPAYRLEQVGSHAVRSLKDNRLEGAGDPEAFIPILTVQLGQHVIYFIGEACDDTPHFIYRL